MKADFFQTLITRIITATILLSFFLGVFFLLPPLVLSVIFALCALYIVVVEWKNIFEIHSWQFWLILPLYPLFSFLLLILLNQQTRYLLLLMLVLVNSFDSGAYLIGSLIGKHKIAPRISPGKTWEGTFGGFISCFFALLLIILFFSSKTISIYAGSLSIINIFFVAIITGFLCFFGDLFESYLKRRAGIKDSGSILPGHGGLLDRFDSILFAIIFFYFFKDYLVSLF